MTEPLASCQRVSKTYATPSGGIEALHYVDAQFHRPRHSARRRVRQREVDAPARARRARPPHLGHIVIDGAELADAPAATLRRHRRDGVAFINQEGRRQSSSRI